MIFGDCFRSLTYCCPLPHPTWSNHCPSMKRGVVEMTKCWQIFGASCVPLPSRSSLSRFVFALCSNPVLTTFEGGVISMLLAHAAHARAPARQTLRSAGGAARNNRSEAHVCTVARTLGFRLESNFATYF